MESIIEETLVLPEKSLPGRNIKQDLEQFHTNIELTMCYNFICSSGYIQSVTELTSIARVSLEDAIDYIDCLRNIGLVENFSEGYRPTKVLRLNFDYSSYPKEKRKLMHGLKVQQLGGMHELPGSFNDNAAIRMTSPELALQFQKKIDEIFKEYNDLMDNVPLQKRTVFVNALAAILVFKKNQFQNQENKNGLN